MSDLQGETSPVEQPASEDSTGTHKTDFWTIATTFALAFYIGWRLLNLMDDDITRLRMLWFARKSCQLIAAVFGTYAIQLENVYNEHHRTMH